MDVWETDEEIVYAFDLPGIATDAVSIEFENGALTISAERERSQAVAATASTGLNAVRELLANDRAAAGCRRGADLGALRQGRARNPRHKARGREAAPDRDR